MPVYRGLQGTSGRAGGALRDERRLRGCTWHVTVNAPTTASAETVAEWQATQRSYVDGAAVYSGYNTLFDSDSTVYFWPDYRAPNGARGGDSKGQYNATLIHLSFACGVDTWEKYINWSRGAYVQGAKERKRILDKFGWPLRVLTVTELDRGLEGDSTHRRLDPGRRSDPGAVVDRTGKFDFNVLYGIVQGDAPPPIIIPEAAMFGYLKHGDEGEDIVQIHHLLNEFFVETGGLPAEIPAERRTAGGALLSPQPKFDNTLAVAYQHAVWRTEGWVLGRPLFAGEEGGSRVTNQALTSLVEATRGLQAGTYDTDPATPLTRSGINLKDAQAAAEWVRANVRVA